MAEPVIPDTLLECTTALRSSLLCEGRSDDAWNKRQQELSALWAIAAALFAVANGSKDIEDAIGGVHDAINAHE